MRLKDAHSAADRESFQRWIAEDPAHQSVYDEVLASYDASGVLRASEIGRRRDLGSVFPKRNRTFGRGIALASIAGLLLLGVYGLAHRLPGLQPVALESVMLSSGEEGRDVILADGSKLSMAPSSEVRIELGRTERLAEVCKGRARLSVANEQRPFRIVAGASSAVASTGAFDAVIVDGRGTVSAVAVSGIGTVTPSGGRTAAATSDPPAARQGIEFNAEPLGQAIERINRLDVGRRIEIDPGLSDLRVTGVFQRGDSEVIGRSMALAFDLKLTSTPSGTLLLTREK
jgi:transmembrane sensor